MNGISFYLNNPKNVGIALLIHFGGWLSDKQYLKAMFRLKTGCKLNLKKPKTFAEKLQWLKLYDRKPIYHQMVDKIESKKLVNSILKEDRAVPTLAVYDSFEQIDWDALPQQFVLKATHDSGSYYIVNDKNSVDKQDCKKHLYLHWNKELYRYTREWQYKGLKSRIIAEPLLASREKLREYKFFCFEGEPKMYQICIDRDPVLGSLLQMVDVEGNLLDIQDASNDRVATNTVFKPRNLDKMLSIAKVMSKGMHFLRVDFYETDDDFYLGELTLHESAGYIVFKPDHWNKTLGSWIHLPIDE